MGFRKTAIATLAIGALVSTVAQKAFAVPITYTEQATTSGSLNGVAFTNTAVSFTETSDTVNIFGGPIEFMNSGRATITLDGGAPVTITDLVSAFSFPLLPEEGFLDVTTGNIIIDDTGPTIFHNYKLGPTMSPISGPAGFTSFSIPTTGGDFIMTAITSRFPATTFVATINVAEPPSLALLGAGLLALVYIVRRRSEVRFER